VCLSQEAQRTEQGKSRFKSVNKQVSAAIADTICGRCSQFFCQLLWTWIISSKSLNVTTLRSPLPFSKDVNEKFSYRRQNALSVIKIDECNTFSERVLFLCRHQSRLVRGVMLWNCLFVCLSVRHFARSFAHQSPQCERDILEMSELKSMQIGTSGSGGKSMQQSTSGVMKSNDEVIGGHTWSWRPRGGIVRNPFNPANRGIQSPSQMLPLKGSGVLHIVLTAPPPPPELRVCDVCC